MNQLYNDDESIKREIRIKSYIDQNEYYLLDFIQYFPKSIEEKIKLKCESNILFMNC